MKKKILALALSLAMFFALAVPATAAAAYTPTGYSLIRFSAKPAGTYAISDYYHTLLLLEDGTKISAVQGEMTVTRTTVSTWEDLFSDESENTLSTTEKVAPGASVTVQGSTVYDVSVTAGKKAEWVHILTRDAIKALNAEYSDICWPLTRDIPANAVPLEGCDHILTTNQCVGYAYLRLDYPAFHAAMADTADLEVKFSGVYPVFPANTVFAAPEGYVFSYTANDMFGSGDIPQFYTRLDMSDESSSVTHLDPMRCGGSQYFDGISFLVDSYNSSYIAERGFGTLIWVDEKDLTSKKQMTSLWAKPQMEQAIDAGLMSFADGANLQNNAARHEFASLMVRLYEVVTGKTAPVPESHPFTDAYSTDMLRAYALGLINGTSATTIEPYGDLTREQAAAIITRLADLLGKSLAAQSPTFGDNADISSWAKDAVGRVQAAGIMNGVGDNRFDPQGKFTREQCILTMMRLYEMVK